MNEGLGLHLAQDRDRWRTLVNAVMNIRPPWRVSVCYVCAPTLSFQGTAQQLIHLPSFDFPSVERQYVQLQIRIKNHVTDAFFMSVRPFAVDLGLLKGLDSPFFQVDDT